MSLQAELHRAHKARRFTWNTRAVLDDGIDLKRPKKAFAVVLSPQPEPPPAIEIAPIQFVRITSTQPPTVVPITRRHSVIGIARFVAAKFELPYTELVERGRRGCRQSHFTTPRHAAFYLAREVARSSFPEIGRRLGGYDHATVWNGHHKTAARIRSDADFAHDIAHMEATLLGRQGEAVVQ